MNFWWVNQNKTHKHEIEGGYPWSPKPIFSRSCDKHDLVAMGIDPKKEYRIDVIDDDHRGFISYHRERIFKD